MTLRLGGYIFIAVLSFATAWMVRGWHEDSIGLAVKNAADAIREDAIKRESATASTVEKRLGELKANQTVIDRGIVREIQKPIYRNVCFDPELVRLLNDAASGATGSDPAKPAGEVPGKAVTAQ
ncbi:hypothetical protein [Agrobacterium tumefaciens]|uniref:hypothetical protein n=1 Tax=Agrobacterium tumefaciens TaxID=358 RepID=UPI00157201BD|nr:hypothetical protein [Agrobacterium tumefaciens]